MPQMDVLLTTIVLWLSLNFGLPATDVHPAIERLPAREIAFLRYGATTPQARVEIAARLDAMEKGGLGPVALYDLKRKTILLAESWTGRTPAELSVLVHEMVHHLQEAGGLKYACPAEREAPAYAAQEKWLGLFGLSLMSEFAIDPFTLKVSTACGF
jgi:hypothetical protein